MNLVLYKCTVCGTKQSKQDDNIDSVCLVCGVSSALITLVDNELINKKDSMPVDDNENIVDDEVIDE